MSLAVENFKFMFKQLPIAMIFTGGMGAMRTLEKLPTNDTSGSTFWSKARPGVGVSVVYLSVYCSLRLLGIRTKNSDYTAFAYLILYVNAVCSITTIASLYKRISNDLDKQDVSFKYKLMDAGTNAAAVMVSVLVGAVGYSIFETIAATYLGQNLNSIFLQSLENAKNCKFCFSV